MSASLRRLLPLAALTIAGSLSGCGVSNPPVYDGGGICTPPPSSCPAEAPSFKTQVLPVVESVCFLCHGPNGPGLPELDSYGALHIYELEALGQVGACLMPPPDAGFTDAQRETLMNWLACGAPDN